MSKRFCKVCGTSYSYCPDCVRDLDKPRWMVSYDKVECQELFYTLVKNTAGEISDEDALKVANRYKYVIKNEGIKKHVERLKSAKPSKVLSAEKEVRAPEIVKKEASETVVKDAPKAEVKEDAIKEDVKEPVVEKKSQYFSNSKNQARTKESADSITSVLNQLNEKDS